MIMHIIIQRTNEKTSSLWSVEGNLKPRDPPTSEDQGCRCSYESIEDQLRTTTVKDKSFCVYVVARCCQRSRLRLYDTAGCPSISTISVLQCFESPNQSASSIFIDTSNSCDANSITAGVYDRQFRS
nr:unnamed protein product [Haemonchus contortus]